jgi:hypothetical protein
VRCGRHESFEATATDQGSSLPRRGTAGTVIAIESATARTVGAVPAMTGTPRSDPRVSTRRGHRMSLDRGSVIRPPGEPSANGEARIDVHEGVGKAIPRDPERGGTGREALIAPANGPSPAQRPPHRRMAKIQGFTVPRHATPLRAARRRVGRAETGTDPGPSFACLAVVAPRRRPDTPRARLDLAIRRGEGPAPTPIVQPRALASCRRPGPGCPAD